MAEINTTEKTRVMERLVQKLSVLIVMLCASFSSYALPTFEADGLRYQVEEDGVYVRVAKCLTDAENIEIPYEVTSGVNRYIVGTIGYEAFSGCTSLKTIKLSTWILKIMDFAFAGCTSLSSVSLPDVKEIGICAFSGCTSLTSIELPDRLETIYAGTFRGCTSLTEINVDPANAHYASVDGVWYDKNISKLICYPPGKAIMPLPETVTTIGPQAFEGFTFESYTVPNSVQCIEEGAFWNCKSLNTIVLPESVTTIGDGAFLECKALASVEIPNSVTYLGSWAFAYCESLSSITLSNSLREISQSTFNGCTSLKRVSIQGSVTSIGEEAFKNCSSLTSVYFPNSVKSIGRSAFVNCSSLDYVTLPKYLTIIDEDAFRGCTALTSITIPERVHTIGSLAFDNCTSLRYISIPASVQNMRYAIDDCPAIRQIDLHWRKPLALLDEYVPASVLNTAVIFVPVGTLDAYKATEPWSRFKNIQERDYSIPGDFVCEPLYYEISSEYLKTISVTGCSRNVAAVEVPGKVTFAGETYDVSRIGGDAFADNTVLTSVVISDNVSTVWDGAFRGCTALSEVTLPKDLRHIDKNVFEGCSSLSSIEIPQPVKRIWEKAFYGCTSLKSITIPKNVYRIDAYAFAECTNLSEIKVDPENETFSDRNGILYNKDATKLMVCPGAKASVTVPVCVTSVEWDAFIGCRKLRKIYMQPTTPIVCDAKFEQEVLEQATLYVPLGTLDAYRATSPWSQFWDIREMDFSAIEAVEGEEAILPRLSVTDGTLTIDGLDSGVPVTIHDMQGRVVRRTTSRVISGLAPGVYVLKADAHAIKFSIW